MTYSKNRKKKKIITSKDMTAARANIYFNQGGKCLCCGKYIPLERITKTNFAHWYNKAWMTPEERLTNQSLVCTELHEWEHNRPGNLEKNKCIQILINKYGNKYKNLLMSKELIEDFIFAEKVV